MEKNKLVSELITVRNTTTTTWGYLPPRPGQEHRETASKVDPIEKLIAAEKMMQMSSHKKKSTRVSPVKSLKDFHASDEEDDELLPLKTSESSPGKLEGLSKLDVKKAKENVFARLTSNKKTTRSRRSGNNPDSVEEQHAFMPNVKTAGKSRTKQKLKSISPIKAPPTTQKAIQKPDGQTKVITINVSCDDTKKTTNGTVNVTNGGTDSENANDNGKTSYDKDQPTEPVRPGRPLSPIKEGTTLTEKSGPGGKRISNRQYSFARSSTKGSIQVKGQRKRKNTAKSDESDNEKNKHNPDGSLRTVYRLPNFEESLEEAQRARYLRLKFKPWFEREMSVSDVWKDRDKPLEQRIRLK